MTIENCPLISVVIPVYNAEAYLPNCIESILKQTFRKFELLLILDGCTDHSENICDEYAGRDKRIKVFKQKNSGVTVARKNGVRYAKGNWICFVDADDSLPLEALNALFSESDGVDMVIGRINIVQEDGKKKRENKVFYQKSENWDKIFFLNALLENKTPLSPCGRICKKELFDDTVFNLPAWIVKGEDYIMCVRLGAKVNHVRVINPYVYNYIQHSTSVLHKFVGSLDYEKRFEIFLFQSIRENNLDGICREAMIHQRINALQGLLNDPYANYRDPYVREICRQAKTIRLSFREKTVINLIVLPSKIRFFAFRVIRKLFL